MKKYFKNCYINKMKRNFFCWQLKTKQPINIKFKLKDNKIRVRKSTA